MRAIVVGWLISGCVSHGLVAGGNRAVSSSCDTDSTCWPGGSGTADDIISVSVVGAIVGVIAVHVYRRATKP